MPFDFLWNAARLNRSAVLAESRTSGNGQAVLEVHWCDARPSLATTMAPLLILSIHSDLPFSGPFSIVLAGGLLIELAKGPSPEGWHGTSPTVSIQAVSGPYAVDRGLCSAVFDRIEIMIFAFILVFTGYRETDG